MGVAFVATDRQYQLLPADIQTIERGGCAHEGELDILSQRRGHQPGVITAAPTRVA